MLARIYNRYRKAKKNGVVALHRRKTYLMEWIAILKKRKLYRDIKWTDNQLKDFNTFWKHNYGKKISPRWHKLFQSINGKFCVDYFPDVIYSTKIAPRMNPFFLSNELGSKAFPGLLFHDSLSSNSTQSFRTPKTYALACYGYYYCGENRQPSNIESIIEQCQDLGMVIIKPAKGGNSGKGFRLLNISSGADTITNECLTCVLSGYKGNFIIQERITNCDAVRALYPNALNTFRVITYILDGQLYCGPISLRMGSSGGNVDNIHAGGFVIGVSERGYLNSKAYKLGYCDNMETIVRHPDSKILFDGYSIPNFSKIVDTAFVCHGRLPGVGIVSWDIVLDENEVPVIIETNLTGQSTWFPQIVNETSLFNRNTSAILNLLNNKGKIANV